MQFQIKHRWTGEVRFECELSVEMETQRYSVQLGFAVRKAIDARANLTRANLTYADLTRANLTYANLTRANLTRANLTAFQQDFIAEVLTMPAELDALRAAIVAGRIDGSTYSGECSCLAGTIAKAHGIDCYDGGNIGDFRAQASSPRERWFAMIKPGDTPETNQASRMALGWLDRAISIRDRIAIAAVARVGAA